MADNQKKSVFTVKNMALIGVMAAAVFAASHMKIYLPANARLHLGNVMCLLSGFLLGPLGGGLAAGFGSAFYDLTDPLYISSMPFTFVFKFAMTWLCGTIAFGGGAGAKRWNRNVLAAVAGALLYIVLYLGKNFIADTWFLRLETETALANLFTRGWSSLVNGIIAAVASVPLAKALQAALERTGYNR